MPPGQLSGLLPCLSREKRPPPVSTSVKAFRHFIDGSLALASPDHTCRNLVPACLQRSPQPLLAAAACSGLRPAPDCRPRRALLHLSYSSAPSYSDSAFVTHAQNRTYARARRNCRRAGLALQADQRDDGELSTQWLLDTGRLFGTVIDAPKKHGSGLAEPD
jgi:hypothetical protein